MRGALKRSRIIGKSGGRIAAGAWFFRRRSVRFAPRTIGRGHAGSPLVESCLMPLPNRVDPFGNLFADRSRGFSSATAAGAFIATTARSAARRWVSRTWICCRLDFKGRHREVWGRGYTELFFLDEPTALAAGHRPCFECRRHDAQAFAAAFRGPVGTLRARPRSTRAARRAARRRAPSGAIAPPSTACPTAPVSPWRTSLRAPLRCAAPGCCDGRPPATPRRARARAHASSIC